MNFARTIRRFIRSATPPAIFVGLTFYFGWNTMQGDHGIKSYRERLKQLDQAEQSRKDAIQEQAVWTRRVSGIRETALDADLLEERARVMLNRTRPDEIVVPYGANNRLY